MRAIRVVRPGIPSLFRPTGRPATSAGRGPVAPSVHERRVQVSDGTTGEGLLRACASSADARRGSLRFDRVEGGRRCVWQDRCRCLGMAAAHDAGKAGKSGIRMMMRLLGAWHGDCLRRGEPASHSITLMKASTMSAATVIVPTIDSTSTASEASVTTAAAVCWPITDPPQGSLIAALERLAGLRHALSSSCGRSTATAFAVSQGAVATLAARHRGVDAAAVSAGRLNQWLLNRRG
jgi:hypothetical protein